MRPIFIAGCLCFAPVAWAKGDAVRADGQTHTVVPGDTLWDLTARYLNNPWYWPKVWSYNQQITNPHFIYPGNTVRFFPGGDEMPARIDASALREMPSMDPPHRGMLTDDKPHAEAVSVAGGRPVGYQSNRGMVVQSVQLVTDKELQEAGELSRAVEDKAFLSNYDLIFLKYRKNAQKPAPGQPLIIYKTIQEVEHPVTGKNYGFLTQITGTAEVVLTGADDELVTAKITKTYEPIERGQLISNQKGPLMSELVEKANTTKLKGIVLSGEWHSRALLGQFHYVFVDRGTKDGVANGNQFMVMRFHDHFQPEGADPEPIPAQVIGKLVVVDAKDTASLALVTQSLRDINPGDHVEMR